jgi:hypothetical protein
MFFSPIESLSLADCPQQAISCSNQQKTLFATRQANLPDRGRHSVKLR